MAISLNFLVLICKKIKLKRKGKLIHPKTDKIKKNKEVLKMSKIAMKSGKIRKKAIDKQNKTKYTENKNYNSNFFNSKLLNL